MHVHPQELKDEEEAESHTANTNHLVKKAEHPEKYHSKHLKQTQATNALIDSVAEDLPLAVVDSCKYKKFVEILDPTYQVPSIESNSLQLY